jgi:hypothetical protein
VGGVACGAVRAGEPNPDLAALPLAVRGAAHVFENGEVAWPNEHAEAAINALARTGKLVLGLDARTIHPDGGLMEIPISAWRETAGEPEADAVERARGEALEALPIAVAEGTHVLITWRSRDCSFRLTGAPPVGRRDCSYPCKGAARGVSAFFRLRGAGTR